MLQVKHLYRSYRGIPAVADVSFQVSPGEIVGFLGPNGAGKSTTVKMITGMLRPNDGHVVFDGRDIRDDMVEFRKILGYVPEEAHLYSYLSGLEYLQLVGRLRGMREDAIEAKATSLLRLLSLESWQHTPISSYSKGMRQRVLIAAALLHDPKLLIFDEPLSGLDVTTAMVFRNLIRLLAAQGKAILYSSHVLEVVEKVSTRVLILRRGKVVAHDSVEHLRALLASPSLEDVFTQVAVQEDTEQVASDLVAVIRG